MANNERFEVELSLVIAPITKSLNSLQKLTKNATSKMADSFKSMQETVSKTSEEIKNVGESLTKSLSLPLAAIGAVGVKSAADMSGAFAKIQAATGVTGKELDALKDQAKSLYKDGFGESIDEITNGLLITRQNMKALNKEDLKKVTQGAITLAEVFDADVSEVTRGAQNLMKGFGIESKKAMDMLAWGSQKGLNFSNELYDNLAEYSTLFGKMGFSIEEYFQLLSQGAEAGAYNLDYVN